MKSEGRRFLAKRNVIAKWGSTILITLVQFFCRKLIIGCFSDDLLGLSGLLQSVISMLSLLELGVGSAIYYSLYEPLANNNYQKITAIMNLYRKIYCVIGLAVFVIGLGLLPFLHLFINTEIESKTVKIAYLIILTDTGLSYFMAYRRNLFNADQKEYYCTRIDTFAIIMADIMQVVIALLTHNYILYLVGRVLWTIGANYYIYRNSARTYPFITEKTDYKLSHEYIQTFKNNLKTLCVSNISSYLVFSTDNLLISTYVNIESIFIYSNYSMIINAVNRVFHNIFTSLQASVGNYIVENDKDKAYILFNSIFLANYLVTCFTSVSLYFLCNPFIRIWLGDKYIWPLFIVAVLVINNYLRFINQATAVFRNALGLYSPNKFHKYWGIIEGIVNLVASIAFIHLFSENRIMGVFLGTTMSTFVVFFFVSTHVLFKYYFGIKKWYRFLCKNLLLFLLTLCYVLVIGLILRLFDLSNPFICLIITGIIVFCIPNVGNYIIFRKTQSFSTLKSLVFKQK